MGNYTTPEEIDEMRELQQVTATVPDAAKRCRQIDGNGAKMEGAARVGRWRSKSKAGGVYW